VGKLCYRDETLQLCGGHVGEITQRLYDALTGIQTGQREDPFGWVRFAG
jgi:branched-chain amino acid aminotransferase